MNEPSLFGLPISVAFLYFMVYSVMGWCLETVYCSALERHFVPRGFLYGPLCPIYGVGVLMMICWFRPFLDRPVLFYLIATVCMSAWEYLVGWFLETTTHIKYWDYSMYRFNLKGRICLWVCLMWGALSFLVLYFIHPRVAARLGGLAPISRYFLDGVLLGILMSDAGATVYQLVRTSQMLSTLRTVGDELRLQAHLGRAELDDRIASLSEQLAGLLPEELDDQARALKEHYEELTVRTELLTRRFRASYRNMRASAPFSDSLESVKHRGERIRLRLKDAKAQLKR